MSDNLFETDVRPLFEAYRAEWLADARDAAMRLCLEKGTVTIDDVRAVCPPPAGVDPRVMGAVMRKPLFVLSGYQRSSRAVCHNRPVAVFRLAENAV